MFSNKSKLFTPLCVIVGFALASCEAPLDLCGAISNNIVWSSDNGRLDLYLQGHGIDEGIAAMSVNDRLVTYEACFDDLYDTVYLYEIDPEVYDFTAPKKTAIEFYVESIVGKSQLKIRSIYNKTGDSHFDDYSTTLTKRDLEKSELDAKFFSNGWVNEQGELVFPYRLDSYLKSRREGTYKNKNVYFRFLDVYRFTIEYQETSEVFASGSYMTHFDNMDLIFDEDCGREEFGEVLNMVWADGSGHPMESFKR